MLYVYELRDARGEVFYVGKGSGRRMYQHRWKAKAGEMTHRACKIRSILARGEDFTANIVFESCVESEAFAKEVELIAKYGRETLTNKTDGGDGVANPTKEAREKIAAMRRGRVASEATRLKQRLAKLGIPRSEETRLKIGAYQKGTKKPWARELAIKNLSKMRSFKGMTHTEETKRKITLAKLGHIVTEETRLKISQSRKGIPAWNKGIKMKKRGG